MSDDKHKDDRIAELEQEVARLQGRLDEQEDEQEKAFFDSPPEGGGDVELAPDPEPAPADPEDQRVLEAQMPSRNRAIVIAVALGIVALVAIVAIVLSLSRVITPLSKSAAGALSPFEASEKTDPENQPQKRPPVETTADPLRAPGL